MAHRYQMSVFEIFRFVVGSLVLFSSGIAGVALAQNPLPLINQPLVPDAVKPGGAGFTLTVNGTGFDSSAKVHWNGSARATTFVNSSRLKAAILSSDIATAGTASVTVVNPSPGGGKSNVVFFEITIPNSSISLGESDPSATCCAASVVAEDFNGDGNMDLALATDGASVLFGNGDGSFQTASVYAAGSAPSAIASGDFNGDGKPDLVLTNNTNPGMVTVLLNNGLGAFLTAKSYSTGPNPVGLAVGDFNADGKLDLVVANSSGNTVSVLLGNGDGTFKPAIEYTVASSPQWAVIGDFNGDGKQDLAVVCSGSGTVSVLLGNGNGTFRPAVEYSVGSQPQSLVAGDFNRDGKLDLAVADNGTDTVSVLLGKGDGTFQAAVDYVAGSQPTAINVVDFNGDGNLDLVVLDYGSTRVSILLGNGDGTFQPPSDWSMPPPFSGGQAGPMGIADFNRDGRLDLVVTHSDGATFTVLLQAPALSVSTSNLAFANQLVGTNSAAQTLTSTNTSGLAAKFSSIAFTGTNPGDFNQTNTCKSPLAPGASCTIDVVFKPTQIGPRNATLTITDNAPDSPQLVGLNGTGVASGANATLSASSLTFSTQVVGTSSLAQNVTLTNFGSVALSITSVAFNGADPGDFSQTNTCGTSLAPGANCSISITFTPKLKGARSAGLVLSDDATGNPQLIALTGTGTVVQLNPASLRFSCVVSSHTCPPPPQSSTLTNTATTPLTISRITISGAFSETNNCPSVLSASGSCTITVHFTSAVTGFFHGSVSINDDGGGSPQLLSLSGMEKSTVPRAALSALGAASTATVPKPTGPNHVGTRIVEVVDPVRDDPYVGSGAKRQLLLRFWYPASMSDGCEPASYTTPALWNYFSHLVGFPLPEVKTNSCLDAPVSEDSHPVVVFTHGYTGTFTDYTFLFEDLASRGYVVASIDHTHEATAVEFPDGRFSKSQVGSHLDNSWQTDEHTVSRALSARLDDLTFVMNELERLNASRDNPFAGKLDLTRVALAGHSLGGLTAWLGLQREPQFKAAILLDPYLADIGSDTTENPVMLLTMGRDKPSSNECHLWSNLRGPRFSVNFEGAEHVTASDVVWLAKGAIKTGDMGPDKTIDALRTYIAAFLDANLRGKAFDPVLTGPSSEYPDATVIRQNQFLCGEIMKHSSNTDHAESR